MALDQFGVVCPSCESRIVKKDLMAICPCCKQQYPIVNGILDLRYPTQNEDTLTQKMIDSFDHSSFEELLSISLLNNNLTQSIYKDTLSYYRDQIPRTHRMTSMFIELYSELFGKLIFDLALDLGCGSGAGIIALLPHFSSVIGLDSSMRQLLLAKKTLDLHTKNNNYILICSYGNCIPIKNAIINYTQAINVFEHLITLKPVIREISRTLSPKGAFVADSRNRFDLFFPEPHTGLRFLGYLPRKFIQKYVLWLTNSQYEQTWLLSYNDLNKTMKKAFNGVFEITFPKISAYNKPKRMDKWLDLIRKLPIIRQIIRVFPTHIILGQKYGGQ